MSAGRRAIKNVAFAAGAMGAVAAATLGAGSAVAAPPTLTVQQVPNAGITVQHGGTVSGGFVADLVAAPINVDATRLSINPVRFGTCTTNLAGTKAAVSWRNETTNRSGSVVFPVCDAGKPSAGAVAATGAGRISFTTTILGHPDQTFTVTPGSGSFTR